MSLLATEKSGNRTRIETVIMGVFNGSWWGKKEKTGCGLRSGGYAVDVAALSQAVECVMLSD